MPVSPLLAFFGTFYHEFLTLVSSILLSFVLAKKQFSWFSRNVITLIFIILFVAELYVIAYFFGDYAWNQGLSSASVVLPFTLHRWLFILGFLLWSNSGALVARFTSYKKVLLFFGLLFGILFLSFFRLERLPGITSLFSLIIWGPALLIEGVFEILRVRALPYDFGTIHVRLLSPERTILLDIWQHITLSGFLIYYFPFLTILLKGNGKIRWIILMILHLIFTLAGGMLMGLASFD